MRPCAVLDKHVPSKRNKQVSHTGLKGKEVAAAGLSPLAATTSSASEHDDKDVPAERLCRKANSFRMFVHVPVKASQERGGTQERNAAS